MSKWFRCLFLTTLVVVVTFSTCCTEGDLPLEFEQGFVGVIDLGDSGAIHGRFDGFLYMEAGDGEWEGYIETLSNGLVILGQETEPGSFEEVWGEINKHNETCFTATSHCGLPILDGATITGCQGDSWLVVEHPNFEDDADMKALPPIHEYFFEEEA